MDNWLWKDLYEAIDLWRNVLLKPDGVLLQSAVKYNVWRRGWNRPHNPGEYTILKSAFVFPPCNPRNPRPKMRFTQPNSKEPIDLRDGGL